MKKEDLKKEYETKYSYLFSTDENMHEVWNFFEPHLKLKSAKPKIEVDVDKVIEYNELWPKIKSGSGKYVRCNITEITKSFERFFKTYDFSWETIFEATRIYLIEQERENFKYTMRSKYFITKIKDQVPVSELAEYAARVLEGGYFGEDSQLSNFEVKVY